MLLAAALRLGLPIPDLNVVQEKGVLLCQLQTPTGRLQQSPSNILVPGVLVPPLSESPRRPPPSTRFEKPSNTTSFDPYSRFGANSLEASLSLTHTERRGTAANASWRVRDIDWKFCFRSQHYGTAFFALMIIIALGVIHWTAKPKSRPFCKSCTLL